MNFDQLKLPTSVSTLLSAFGIRSAVTREVDERVDSFAGDQFIFLEILRGELLRDAKSSASAVMLRVSRAVSNEVLSRIYQRRLAAFMEVGVTGKRGADLLEALIGSLVLEGELENASRLTDIFFQDATEIPNLRYPSRPIERVDSNLGELSATAADAIGVLFCRLLVAAVRPSVRELHSESQRIAAMLRPLWRGSRKRPSVWCQKVISAFAEQGVGAALKVLEAPFAEPSVLSQVKPASGFEQSWELVRALLSKRASHCPE